MHKLWFLRERIYLMQISLIVIKKKAERKNNKVIFIQTKPQTIMKKILNKKHVKILLRIKIVNTN